MGSFAAFVRDPEAWRRGQCWQGDLRPYRFVSAGVAPDILEAANDDVEALNADLDNTRLTAAGFDGRHKARLARIWSDEAPAQAAFVRSQLGTDAWADGTHAPCPWSDLRKARTHRSMNPWTPTELEAALNRNGPRRPDDAPMGALAQTHEVAKASRAAAPAPSTPPSLPGRGGVGPEPTPVPGCFAPA